MFKYNSNQELGQALRDNEVCKSIAIQLKETSGASETIDEIVQNLKAIANQATHTKMVSIQELKEIKIKYPYLAVEIEIQDAKFFDILFGKSSKGL
jgi:hypothetical protein